MQDGLTAKLQSSDQNDLWISASSVTRGRWQRDLRDQCYKRHVSGEDCRRSQLHRRHVYTSGNAPAAGGETEDRDKAICSPSDDGQVYGYQRRSDLWAWSGRRTDVENDPAIGCQPRRAVVRYSEDDVRDAWAFAGDEGKPQRPA